MGELDYIMSFNDTKVNLTKKLEGFTMLLEDGGLDGFSQSTDNT
jgi:hypothetical protein